MATLSEVLASALLGLSPPALGDDGVSPLVVPVSRASVVAARVLVTTAPTYTPPPGPGWWADDGDLSDEDHGIEQVDVGGIQVPFRSSVKSYRAADRRAIPFAAPSLGRSGRSAHAVDASKAYATKQNKVKFSLDADGGHRRHAIPDSFEQAMLHEESGRLWEACLREMAAHDDCKTWLVRDAKECYAEGREPIGCRWVFDTKIDATTRELLMWKARLVARGDQMIYLQDFIETYAGVCRHATLRLLLSLAALWSLVLTGADVSTAYLHAPLRDAKVWMYPPQGFPQTTPDGQPALLLLQMALYGLRQSAREWAITFREWLLAWAPPDGDGRFRRCESDPYMFVWRCSRGVFILLLWVDDFFMAHSHEGMRSEFMAAAADRFRLKDLGPLRQALGASVYQDLPNNSVTCNLERYILDATRRFGLHVDNSWADIPAPAALVRAVREAQPSLQEVAATTELFRVMSGVVVHVATFLRPDVQFAAQLLSSVAHRAGEDAMRLARRVLGYLARTAHLGLTYRRDTRSDTLLGGALPADLGVGSPHLPVDADHAADRSYTGWVFILAGAAVAWGTRAQVLPSLSSAEAELYGLSTAVAELLACLNVLEDMGLVFPGPIVLLTDSRGARLIATDCQAPARTRHIHRRWFFVRYHVDTRKILIKEVKGANNPSNFLTKAVGGASYARDREYVMGLRAEP